MSLAEPREECLRCMKPKRLCLCARIPRIACRTRVIVVQHPRERAHPIGTARFVELGLAGSEVHVALGLDASPALRALGDARAVLLHPSRTSVALESIPPDERPDVLVVVDGTWPMAKTLVRANPALAALPQVHLSPPEPSRYRIRREPSIECVSTLEATLHALRALEPGLEGCEALLAAFDSMIDAQIDSHRERADGARHRGPPSRGFIGVPVALGERYRDLVLVYAEPSLRRADGTRSLLRWSAVRLADAAVFDAFLRPEPALDPSLVPVGAPELLAAREGEVLEAAAARFRDFAGPSAIVGAWNGELVARATRFVGDRQVLDLAAAHRAVYGAGQGVLEKVVVHLALGTAAVDLPGRASTRLGNAVSLAEHLHAQARERALRKIAAASVGTVGEA